jgi:hypothetical protein
MAIGFLGGEGERVPHPLFAVRGHIHLLDRRRRLHLSQTGRRADVASEPKNPGLPSTLPETIGGLALIALFAARLVGSHGVRGCLMDHGAQSLMLRLGEVL